MFMAAADQTLLATATPAIAATLGGLRDSSWIAVAYLLASATIVPVYGRLGDSHGRRNMLLVALAVFVIGSVACGFARSMPQLVAARVLQGLGGGGLMTLAQATIGELVPPLERVRFQGYFALVFATASIGGPVLGGIIVSHLSWRWLFFANLPLAALAAWRLGRLPTGERFRPDNQGTDAPGHVLFATGALAALFWLTSVGHRFGWASPAGIAILALAVLCLAALYRHERRHPAPFLPVDLWRQATVRLSALLVFLFAACLFSLVFFLPIYLQLGRGASAQSSGLLLLPITAGQVSASLTVARLARRLRDPQRVPAIGMAVTSVAMALLALLPPNRILVIVMGFAAGVGFGTVMAINQVVLQTAAGRARLGAVTAMSSLARATGGATGAALFGALIFAMIPDTDRQTLLQHASEFGIARVVAAFHHGFLLVAGLAALASLTASRIPRVALWKSPEKDG
jgi:EmrB/QacA subfamily drug resistance transporter